MEEGVEEEVGIGDTNMLEIILVELVGIFSTMVILQFKPLPFLNFQSS